jgi:hypothetical protein
MVSAEVSLPPRQAPELGGTGRIPAPFHAQSADLRFPPMMDVDFAKHGLLVQRWRLISGFCSLSHVNVRRFLQTPPRDDALAFR